MITHVERKWSLRGYNDAHILVKGRIKITGTQADAAGRQVDERHKKVLFKNCVSFTHCISKINNTKMDNAKDLDVVMPLYDLIKFRDNYSKTPRSLFSLCSDNQLMLSKFLNH